MIFVLFTTSLIIIPVSSASFLPFIKFLSFNNRCRFSTSIFSVLPFFQVAYLMFESHFLQSYGQNRSTFSQYFSYVVGQGMGAEEFIHGVGRNVKGVVHSH